MSCSDGFSRRRAVMRSRATVAGAGSVIMFAMLAAGVVMCMAQPAACQALRAVLAEEGVVAPIGANDLDHAITSFAVLNDPEVFGIAYYWQSPGDPALADSVRIHILEKSTGTWVYRAVPRTEGEDSSSGGAQELGSITQLSRVSDYLYVDSHLNPSAGTVLILTRATLEPVGRLPGWTQLLLPSGFVVYERGGPHFAPTYSAELWGFDPRSGRRHLIYPRPPYDSLRTAYIQEVTRIYGELGEDWFREHNHPMDPERFDSRVLAVASDSVDELAVAMRFGTSSQTPAATPVMEVIVLCAEVQAAEPRCTEVSRSVTEQEHPGMSGKALLEAVLRGRQYRASFTALRLTRRRATSNSNGV